MSRIAEAVMDLQRLDLLAEGDSPLHRLDPRAPLLATMVFIVMLVSFERHQVSRLLPFFIFPAVMISMAGLPVRFLLRKAAMALPFALAMGLFDLFTERETALTLGAIGITGGWLTLCSLALRSFLAVGAALTLTATAGFGGICGALERLGVPPPFVIQLLFLHRYLFVLAEEGERASRARELRSGGGRCSLPPMHP